MSTGAIIFNCDGEQVPCRGGAEQAQDLRSIDAVEKAAADVLNLPQGTFDLHDPYGQIRQPEDLHRAIRMALAGKADCHIDVKEHFAFRRIKTLEATTIAQDEVLQKLQKTIDDMDADTEKKIEAAKIELLEGIKKVENKVVCEVLPTIEALCKDRTQTQKELRTMQEKMASISLQELRDMSEKCDTLHESVKMALKRADTVETNFNRDKGRMEIDIKKTYQDVTDLSKYIAGKIDICIEADADLKREVQLTNERMQLLKDDVRLNKEELRDLTVRTSGALEESEELRTLMGTVREDNEHLRNECGQVRTRVHVIEGTASEQWAGFAPGVLYFRRFHPFAKGIDVQLARDLSVATGRGFLAATGVVMGNDEGLCVGDGPCRRFGTPGAWASYFEIEIDEICAAPAGSGGLFVGVSLQNGEEIGAHPQKEFDGWLVGGNAKALILRAAVPEGKEPQPLSALQPAAFGADISTSAAQKAGEALKMLRAAMPSKPKGEVKELDSTWNSDDLRPPDRIGILFKCHRDGGARLRVMVNGDVKCSHEFSEAPPAEAMGFLTPVVRLAGTGKSVKLLPGLTPPARALAD